MKRETNFAFASQCIPDMRSNFVYIKHLISGKTLHPGTFTMKLAIKWDPKYSDLISKMTMSDVEGWAKELALGCVNSAP